MVAPRGFSCLLIAVSSYDAILVLSFGGPEEPDDVLPFLRNVTKGRNVPDDRLAIVAEQYAIFGGRSPINDHCRQLIAALETELREHQIDLPIYWGNRNWEPYLNDTVATMAADGVSRALVYVTSAFGSYSGCRQYRENLEAARTEVGDSAPALEKLRLFYNHPGFLGPVAEHVVSAIRSHDQPLDNSHRVIFTAHSIPTSMAAGCDYEGQLREAASLVSQSSDGLIGPDDWDLVFQSRSGPPQVPWLEPDICDHLEQLAADGTTAVTVVPLGFVSDHMEVQYDLDTQAAEKASDLGLAFRRATTVGDHPRFVSMIRELIEERLSETPRLHLGSSGPWPDNCPEGHCAPPVRPPGQRPGQRPT